MVLQQKAENRIWGEAKSNSKVELYTSWNCKTQTTRSDSNGHFEFSVLTPSAGGPYFITISDGDKITLDDVLIGEVWLCSGQSNMEMPVKGFKGQPVAGAQESILNSGAKTNLRLFTVKRASHVEPQSDVEGQWKQSSPSSVRDFSATAFFFGSLLTDVLNVPVGLIHASWSGSKIEPWMNKQSLEGIESIDLSMLERDSVFESPSSTPTLLYNAMIHPLLNVNIKGVIWYQGESNSGNPRQYEELFRTWVNQWRTDFKQPSMPIYFTQIAPYKSSDTNGINLPLFRESQLRSMYQLENVGMAVTTDLGHKDFIHSPFKRQVGERLAYWALSQTYNIEGVAYQSPEYGRHKIIDQSVVEIEFDHALDGLTPENEDVLGFEIADQSGMFIPAKAKIINGSSKVRVWREDGALPKEVRYCFRNYAEGNLYSNLSIPATAFRIVVE